jgi:hypothetical protein
MSYDDFSEGFKAYVKLRDVSTSGLEKCDFMLEPDKLEQRGFKRIHSEYYTEGQEEHEFHEFDNGNYRVVYLETYVEREGGIYIQGLFTKPEHMQNLRKLFSI